MCVHFRTGRSLLMRHSPKYKHIFLLRSYIKCIPQQYWSGFPVHHLSSLLERANQSQCVSPHDTGIDTSI